MQTSSRNPFFIHLVFGGILDGKVTASDNTKKHLVHLGRESKLVE